MRGTVRREPSTGTLDIPSSKNFNLYQLEVGEPERAQTLFLVEGISLTIGSSNKSDIQLEDRTVSAKHCLVRFKAGRLWLEDLGSKNGVFTAGARVSIAELTSGASFVVGRVTIGVRGISRTEPERETGQPIEGMIGSSLPMLRLAGQIRRLARTAVPVLVRGETGSGKELVARALHDQSLRAQCPFIAINAGAIPQELAAAELFGHEKGAFTSAHSRRDGAFLSANTGTLFLDEIAELSLDTQVKLLRVLEQREVCPVGRTIATPIDVRVVCATWADLNQRSLDGLFREDLLHRLSVGLIRVPNLAERPSDIAALTAHFLRECESDVGPKKMSSAALAFLTAQRWPGNVRQLRNIVSRAAINTDVVDIGLSEVISATAGQNAVSTKMSQKAARSLVARCSGRVATAARVCGVPRSTFRGWLGAEAQKEPPMTSPVKP